MTRALGLALALMAGLALGGCASIGRAVLIPKFKIDVPAGQLNVVAAPTETRAETMPGNPIAPTPSLDPATPASRLSPVPARTDIRGVGQGSMKIDRVMVTGARPLPHRAPNYSAEQIAAMVCRTERYGFANAAARAAHQATLAASEARAAFEAGTMDQKQVDETELKRQEAVRRMAQPIPLLNLLGDAGQKKSELPAARYRSVVIEGTEVFTFKENGKLVLAVSGLLRNQGEKSVELPPLTLRALDDWEYALAGQSSLLPFDALSPKETRRFELRFLNPPETTSEVYVHFAPPFLYRATRSCNYFDPATFDPTKTLDDVSFLDERLKAPKLNLGEIRRFIADAGPHAGATAPNYTAAELNVLTRYYRRESERAWRCRDASNESSGARCAGTGQRLGWRDMFAIAEAIDEGWVALAASEAAKTDLQAGRGSSEAVRLADSARVRAFARFQSLGEAALTRAGSSIKDVDIELTTSTLAYDGHDLYVEASGRMHNSGAQSRTIEALMLAAVDRFGLPLLSSAAPFSATLAPGESVDFKQRVPLSRPPPRELEWSVRIGAMGKSG